MLCKDCDYYHALRGKAFSGTELSFCEFSDMLFLDDVDRLETEYPCRKISFDEYWQKKTGGRCDAATVGKYVKPKLFQELKESGVCMLQFPDGIIGKCFREQLAGSEARADVLKPSKNRVKG